MIELAEIKTAEARLLIKNFAGSNEELLKEWRRSEEEQSHFSMDPAELSSLVALLVLSFSHLNRGLGAVGETLDHIKVVVEKFQSLGANADLEETDKLWAAMARNYAQSRSGLSVEKISEITGIELDKLNQHLDRLKIQGVVRVTAKGSWKLCNMKD